MFMCRAGARAGRLLRSYSSSASSADISLSVCVIDSRVLMMRPDDAAGATRRRKPVRTPSKPKPQIYTSEWLGGLLNREVRTALKDLGMESTGKPWVIRERLEEAMPAAAARASGPKDNAPDIRAKYLAKLAKAKQGGGRKEDLSKAGARLDGVHVSATGVLDYLRGRGLARVLLPSASLVADPDPDRRARAVQDLVASCGPEPFEGVMDEPLPADDGGTALLRAAQSAGGGPSVEAHRVVVLCADEDMVKAAKGAGAHAAFVEGCEAKLDEAGARRARYAATRTLEHLRDVQWIVEDFNGISHRLSVRETSMDMFDR